MSDGKSGVIVVGCGMGGMAAAAGFSATCSGAAVGERLRLERAKAIEEALAAEAALIPSP